MAALALFVLDLFGRQVVAVRFTGGFQATKQLQIRGVYAIFVFGGVGLIQRLGRVCQLLNLLLELGGRQLQIHATGIIQIEFGLLG